MGKKQELIRIGKLATFNGQVEEEVNSDSKTQKTALYDSKKRHFFGKDVIKALRRLREAVSVALLAAILIFMLDGCKPEQIIVEKDKLVYVTKDSIVHRDSTVYVPVEVYKDYALDTLVLRTSLAESKSWLDTSSAYLVGEIRNLKALEVKYIEVDKWHTNDSLVYKEKPVPYPVIEEKIKRPWWAWICLTWTFVTLLSIGLMLYKKIFK